MAIATPPRAPARPPPAAPPGAPGPRDRSGDPGGLRRAAQLVAFAVLAFVVARRWTAQLDPAPTGRMAAMAAIATAIAVVLTLAGRLPVRRAVATAAALAGALAVAAVLLLVSGAADELLRPSRWPDLATGLTDGLAALPDLRIPYRGEDEWTRTVLALGGGLLLVLGGVLVAVGGGRPLAATTVLGVVYSIPVVTTKQAHPVLDGVVFAVLAGLLAVAWRVPWAQAPAAAVAGLAALAVAALLAPQLDSAHPLVDYQALGKRVKPPPTTIYDWDHSYAPLGWPRSGKELLRVRATAPNYLKGVSLDRFDGLRWLHSGLVSPGTSRTEGIRSARPDWQARVAVTVRELRSRQVYAPGQIMDVVRSSVRVQQGPLGSFVASRRLLTRGDSYVVQTYAPRPTRRELRSASIDYPDGVQGALRIELPASVGGPQSINPRTGLLDRRSSATILTRPWGVPGEPLRLASTGQVYDDGAATLARSDYARTWALAQRLRLASSSPYDLALRIQRRVREGATYDERPPRSRVPLDAFLFDVHLGYCQQFSGAMALLLRMSGVPARVASGFAPGRRDRSRDEFIVTDLDAHSWVEAFFPHIGWVVFDPTPASGSPATLSGGPTSSPVSADAADTSRVARAAATAGPAAEGTGSSPWRTVGLVLLVAATLCGLVAVVVDRRRRRAALAAGGPDLAELLHALNVTGRRVAPGTTLGDLQQRFRSSPDACRYLAAVVRGRFGGGDGPDGEDRAALRRALGAGLGFRGALRAWWALPPALRRPPGAR